MRSAPNSLPRRWLQVDWVVVSVSGIRRWGLLAFFVLLAGGVLAGVLYFLHEPIEKQALHALRRATAAQDEVRRAGISESLAPEYDQASRLLDEVVALRRAS